MQFAPMWYKDIHIKEIHGVMKQKKTKNFITIINILLLFMLAFIGFNTVEKVLGAKRKSVSVEPLAAKDNTLVRNTSFSSNFALQDYKPVWERNLFNTSQKTLSSPQKQIDLTNIAETDKNIGLKLLGTVVADNPTIKSAIVEYNKDQNIYHEGDTAGNYVIKKILRNNVIITTENGDRLLAVESGHADRGKVVLASSSQAAPKAYRRNRSGGRFRTVELPREEIMAAFDDIDQLISKVGTSPYKFGKLAGFKIDSVSDKSILKKIGLRSHDKILALNGKSIKGEHGAFEFFKQISEGKKVTIKFRRRNRTRRIELNPI
jgi:type II secretion system protein C